MSNVVMIYVSIIAVLFTVVWWVSIVLWLRANPVPPLAEIPDWRVRRYSPPSTNYHQAIHGAYASSAWATLGVMAATASFHPGAMWPVEDPSAVSFHRSGWLPD